MNRRTQWIAGTVAAAVLVGPAGMAKAQNATTGMIGGVVRDAQQGVLPGAGVVAVHVPTGTEYEVFTRADGRFDLLNVQVGPYDLEVAMSGFGTQSLSGVVVTLGEATEVPVTLQLAALTETVEVIAEASEVFSPSRSGTTAGVASGVIETLPTIERSLQDFARVNPFFVKTSRNADSESFLSVAGRSGRYNNIQIDGAVNNDLFGLARQGTPGGQANTQPISLDAVSELQLVVAPYDVRQSGFSGGGINVITRSGANAFSGTGYFFSRNEGLVGSGIDDVPIATFFDRQQGASVGGPLARNRAFFFANFESQRRETPVGYSLDGSSGVDFGRLAEAQRIVQTASSRFGYDIPGGFGELIRGNPNDKLFVRTDVNLSPGHRLSLRHNYVNGTADVGSQSNFRYRFTDNFYLFESATNSTVGQIDSAFGNAVNQARISVQRIRDRRGPRTAPFPQVTIDLEGGEEIRFGTEQFSTANALDQDIIEIHNDLTWVRGRHQFTIGTHNELFKFRNLFIRDNFGVYEFTSPELFAQGLAQSYSYSFSRTSDPRQAAEFWVYQLGFYAGDQWRVRDDLSLTYGLRLDAPIFPDTPTANPLVGQLYGRGTDVVPATRNWSPRIGFNYDLSPSQEVRQQVRGGLGLFHGRTPYVWLSNQYSNTGNEFQRIRVFFNPDNRIPFSADPNNQPTDIGSASTNEINLVDPRLPLSAAPARQPGLRPGPRVLQPDRERRAALLEDVAGHRLPQPEPRRERRRAGRQADLHAAAPGLQQRRPAHQHGGGKQLDDRDEAGQAVQRQLVPERFVSLWRVPLGQRRRVEPGHLELALQLQRGQPERGAAGRLELLAGPPVQPVRLVPDSGRAGGSHPGRLLQRPAGASVQLSRRKRQQRRRDAGQRFALRAARHRRGDRRQRGLRRPDALPDRRLRRHAGRDRAAQCLPRALDLLARLPRRRRRAGGPQRGRGLPGRPEPGERLQQRERAGGVRVLPEPAAGAVERRPGDRPVRLQLEHTCPARVHRGPLHT